MGLLGILTILLGVCGLFAVINEKFLRLPLNIGLTLVAIVFGLIIILAHTLGIRIIILEEIAWLSNIDFSKALMRGMLCFLLFAGAITVPSSTLRAKKWSIIVLALLATTIAAFLIGLSAYGVFRLLGFSLPLAGALVFGAIISPTDPIAAIAILSPYGLPPKVETVINGESLFNDGVGVVLFTTFIALSGQQEDTGPVLLFLREVVGGITLGVVGGLVSVTLLRIISLNTTALLISLAAVSGCYTAGLALGVSGPIATVVLGLVVGGHLEGRGADDTLAAGARDFWHLLDNILNAVLFVLLGLQILVLSWSETALLAMLLLIPLSLASRWLSVAASLGLLDIPRRHRVHHLGLVNLLTWTGMRGGLAVALAMSLPAGPDRSILLTVTFGIVAFSILVQGLTIRTFFSPSLLRRISRTT